MNRAERRRLLKQGQVDPAELEFLVDKIREEERLKASEKAFFYMLAIPTMVIHDKFSQLIKVKVEDKTREERFVSLCLELFDHVYRENVSIDDLHKCLKEEAGIELQGFVR